MKKTLYDNPLRRQCFSLDDLMPIQFENSLASVKELLSEIPNERWAKVKKIIVTGCGDSWLAAEQASAAFDKYLFDSEIRMEARRAIDVSRYYAFSENAEDTAVIAISASGKTARIVEILERAKKHNCIAIALTNSPESPSGLAADYIYETKTPAFPDKMPGLRSYFASLLSLLVLAAFLGEKDDNEYTQVNALKQAAEEYTKKFFQEIESIDEQAFRVATDWQNKAGIECIADGPWFTTSEFISAKYAEVSGDLCTIIDSENYMHVNSMITPKGEYATASIVFSDEENVSRLVETCNIAVDRDKRSLYLASDASPEKLGISVPCFYSYVPAPPKEYRFLATLYAFFPGSLVASYQAALNQEPYFRGGGKFFDPEINTLQTNKIVVL